MVGRRLRRKKKDSSRISVIRFSIKHDMFSFVVYKNESAHVLSRRDATWVFFKSTMYNILRSVVNRTVIDA